MKTEMKHDSSLKSTYDAANSKAARGKLCIAWNLDKSQGEVYQQLTVGMHATSRVAKTERWMSWKEVCDKFGEEETNLHMSSGRITWKEDPVTAGVYQYQDNFDYSRVKVIDKKKMLERTENKEGTAEEDFDTWFDSLTGQGNGLFLQDDLWCQQSGGLSGKGGGGAGGKGKGKGKGKDTPVQPLALEDMPTEQQLQLCLQNARKLQGFLQKAQRDMEETMVLLEKYPSTGQGSFWRSSKRQLRSALNSSKP